MRELSASDTRGPQKVAARLLAAPRGGDIYIVNVSATGRADNQIAGGSFKLNADTEDWDNSIGQNTPGQSGTKRAAYAGLQRGRIRMPCGQTPVYG